MKRMFLSCLLPVILLADVDVQGLITKAMTAQHDKIRTGDFKCVETPFKIKQNMAIEACQTYSSKEGDVEIEALKVYSTVSLKDYIKCSDIGECEIIKPIPKPFAHLEEKDVADSNTIAVSFDASFGKNGDVYLDDAIYVYRVSHMQITPR